MNTISTSQNFASLLADFERQSGHIIPTVTSFADQYSDYCDCMPCRLPDGSAGVIDINLKALVATGVMQ